MSEPFFNDALREQYRLAVLALQPTFFLHDLQVVGSSIVLKNEVASGGGGAWGTLFGGAWTDHYLTMAANFEHLASQEVIDSPDWTAGDAGSGWLGGLNLSGITWAFWMRSSGVGNVSLFSHVNVGDTSRQILRLNADEEFETLFSLANDTTWDAFDETDTPENTDLRWNRFTALPDIRDGNWHHVVVGNNTVNEAKLLVVDGVVVMDTAGAGNGLQGFSIPDENAEFGNGRTEHFGASYSDFFGDVASFAGIPAYLTADQAIGLYEAATHTSGMGSASRINSLRANALRTNSIRSANRV